MVPFYPRFARLPTLRPPPRLIKGHAGLRVPQGKVHPLGVVGVMMLAVVRSEAGQGGGADQLVEGGGVRLHRTAARKPAQDHAFSVLLCRILSENTGT